jgi:hypothetical protein
MTAVAVEPLRERPRLRLLEPVPSRVEAWEVQSELTLVSPEVRAHALGQLPERRPYAFLDFPAASADREPPAVPELRLAHEVPAYVLRRALQAAQASLTLMGSLVAIALAAELFH